MSNSQNQKTIRREAAYTGIGLHTGNSCSLRFLPAPANSGVTFVRTDLPEKPRLPATIEYVVGVVRGTTLGTNGTRVHTVEHICSALLGLGIDNLIVELDANEPPVGDGSAKPFVETLLRSGLQDLDAPKHFFEYAEPIRYQSNETEIILAPGKELTVHCRLTYKHPMIKDQEATFVITPETYIREIAPARTFCFDYEVEALKRKGLAKGGSLDNAVVIGMDRIHNKEKDLRFPDEFVRHKVLDFLGDIFLLGKTVRGRVDAVRVGHGHNVNFVREMIKTSSEKTLTHG